MPQPISSYLVGDTYTPTTPKPSLQQYDNYQIYDLYCVDITYTNSKFTSKPINHFLAVQRFSPIGIPECDFNQLAIDYP